MALPQQLGDGPTHRVADRYEPVDSERVGHGDDVIGTVGEPEAAGRPDAPTVPAVVDRDHAEVAAEREEAREPVEVRRSR